jgi:multiple antibiotic resistance protein
VAGRDRRFGFTAEVGGKVDELQVFARAIPLAFAALFPLINPVGTAIILLGMTRQADLDERRRIARTVSINTVLLLAVVLVAGRAILGFFGISVPIVQLSGGLVLAAMGWKMLFSSDDPSPGKQDARPTPDAQHDYQSQAFYPFTFPLTVGPGGIAVAITLSAHTSRTQMLDTVASQLGALAGIVLLAGVTYLCYANAGRISARLGPSGMAVLQRLSAFIIVCLGAEIAWNGARVLAGSLHGAG